MVTFIEDLSYSDSKCIVARSIKASKNSCLHQSQIDSDAVPSKRREHLLAISSFLFAVIWGFGAHLPSRYLQGWRGEMERRKWDDPWVSKPWRHCWRRVGCVSVWKLSVVELL